MLSYLKEHRSSVRTLFLYGAIFVCGGLMGVLLAKTYGYPSIPCHANLQFINQEIACGAKTIVDKTNYDDLRVNLISYINGQKNQGHVTDVAVYFRDLDNGPVFGINENEDFSPASLLKLPLAFVFFDLEESGIPVLGQFVKYTNAPIVDVQTFAPAVSAEPNQPYSIETLLSNVLTYSDNISYQMLVGYLNGQPDGLAKMNQTFQSLGIIDPQSDTQNTITVRGYASLFRLLYNASYLNDTDSEKILSWLSKSDFNAGLVAGVPKGTVVAHKFGEREVGGLAPVSQLHDCGIVYYPGNPYELCIMTRGSDIKDLPPVISTISGMVYKEVDSRRL